MVPLLFAGLSAIGNYMEKDTDYKRRTKMKDDYVSKMESLVIDDTDRTKRLDQVSDMFNPAITNDLNQSAIKNAISGVVNPVQVSALIPAKAEAMAKESMNIENQNTQIMSKISEASLMDIPKPGFFDFLSGGIEGYGIGAQFESMSNEEDRRKKMMGLLESTLGGNKSVAPNSMPSLTPFMESYDNIFKDLSTFSILG